MTTKRISSFRSHWIKDGCHKWLILKHFTHVRLSACFFLLSRHLKSCPTCFEGIIDQNVGLWTKPITHFPSDLQKKKKKSVDKTVSITACMLYKCVSRIIFTKTCLLVVLNNNGIQFYIILLTNGQRHHEFLLFTNYKEQVCLCFHSYFYT